MLDCNWVQISDVIQLGLNRAMTGPPNTSATRPPAQKNQKARYATQCNKLQLLRHVHVRKRCDAGQCTRKVGNADAGKPSKPQMVRVLFRAEAEELKSHGRMCRLEKRVMVGSEMSGKAAIEGPTARGQGSEGKAEQKFLHGG